MSKTPPGPREIALRAMREANYEAARKVKADKPKRKKPAVKG